MARRLHLWVLLVTLASWFGLGLFYGWGYCFLTDWHWAIKRKLGEEELPASFINYAADKITGSPWPAQLVNDLTLYGALGALLATLIVNFIPLFNKKPS